MEGVKNYRREAQKESVGFLKSSLNFLSELWLSGANKLKPKSERSHRLRVDWSVADYFIPIRDRESHNINYKSSTNEDINPKRPRRILSRTHSWKPTRNNIRPNKQVQSKNEYVPTTGEVVANYSSNIFKFSLVIILLFASSSSTFIFNNGVTAQEYSSDASGTDERSNPIISESIPQPSTAATCFGGLQTFEKISMSSFENPSGSSNSPSGGSSFASGVLIQQDDQALTSECVNLCRSQSNCLSFVIDYNKFECKSYATTQQELQQEFDVKFQNAKANSSNSYLNNTEYQASASYVHFQHLLPSASSNYFEKICLDGVANRNQFSDVCGQGRLWSIERVVDSFLDGYVEKEVTNVNNKDECSKLCIFETQFVCRSADYDSHSRLCRLSKEDRRTQPQGMRHVPGSNRQYLENQCATPGPSSCVYETKRNVGIISMDALKFAQTVLDCQMKCNQESTFNCRSYSFHQQRCFLSGDDSSSLNTNSIKFPIKQGWLFGEKRCLVELCDKGVFSYEKITGFTLRSALSTPIDLMMPGSTRSGFTTLGGNNSGDTEKMQHESSQTRLRGLLPAFHSRAGGNSSMVSTMMMMAANGNSVMSLDPLHEAASSHTRHQRSSSNLAITDHCRHSCDLGSLNCPAFTVDYKNNRCQRLDRNSQGRNHELVARDGFAYYEKICLRVPEMMSMCQDKYWIFERVIGYELAPRHYDKSLKFVQSRRDCEEYCLEEKQFQCRSALYNEETSDCKLSHLNRRLVSKEGGYYRNFNIKISYLENQCIRDHGIETKQCQYERAGEEPAYPTFTELIEMVPSPKAIETEGFHHQNQQNTHGNSNSSGLNRFGPAYCEQICNDNARFECHSFGYYSSTAQCFISGDDTISAGELSTTPSTGFVYYEKRCKLSNSSGSGGGGYDVSTFNVSNHSEETSSNGPHNLEPNPYFQPPSTTIDPYGMSRPSSVTNNNISVIVDQHVDYDQPGPVKPTTQQDTPGMGSTSSVDPNQYKCGDGHTFVYQRIFGFEPIGGYLTLLVKNNDQPGIVSECSNLCKRAYECRAFIVDYNNNQCFAMLENSSVGMLSLRQSLGKDYFEGFCASDHLLLFGSNCRNKTWIMDKIVDQAVIGVQHQKILTEVDKVQCRQACLEERLFFCKSAMYDSNTNECKLYSIDRESTPQMRLLFTKGVDFFENQCQITSNSCPYDAIERDMTIITTTKSIQARSTFDCETACNTEISFNCRSYTYLDKYPSLPNTCLLSSDSRSTSQKGSVREHPRTLYAERNCYYRRPRNPGGNSGMGGMARPDPGYSSQPPVGTGAVMMDPYQGYGGTVSAGGGSSSAPHTSGHTSAMDKYNPTSVIPEIENNGSPIDIVTPIGQSCEPHQYTFERSFGFDYRLGQKERAPIAPTIGISIACQQECLRRGDKCQSFVVDYALPYQSCFLIDTQVGTNKKLLIKSPNSAYFEKICLPRTGLQEPEPAKLGNLQSSNLAAEPQTMDVMPSYSSEPWAPQPHPNQLPYYLKQQQLVQNYPSRSCAKLWAYERFANFNFTAPSDRIIENSISKSHCETQCLNEASFSCRSSTFDYNKKLCRLFKNTRRTIMSQFVNLDMQTVSSATELTPVISGDGSSTNHQGSAHVISGDLDTITTAASGTSSASPSEAIRRQQGARQLAPSTASTQATAEPVKPETNIDYLENTCAPEPSSCQYRQFYDQFSPYIDKLTHAISLSDCQRQCDSERLFSCKSINYDPATKNCMLLNEDLISLNRGHQGSLLPKKGTIYSEKGNCELISVQCNSQEMLVSINFDAPFRGRVMAKGNPDQCFLIGDGQTSIQFPIVFGPKCNSRQEGHNTFVNEVVIQQHPVIMTDSDKTVRVMCAFEAPDQTITLKHPTSRDNKTGIDVGTQDSSRTRHDKMPFNSVVSNKASPPSVLLRILDPAGRDASMINLGDDLILRIQMQMDGQNSALGIFARNLAARSSNGESLLLIDNDGCPIDPQVFPSLEVDPKDGKSLQSTFKAFRFPSSGLVNFEVQIRFCPERCQPVNCHRGKMRSYGRRKRDTSLNLARTSIIQSISKGAVDKNPLDALSTVMKPGKAFQYVRELMLASQSTTPKPEEMTFAVNIEPTSTDKPVEDANSNLEAQSQPATQEVNSSLYSQEEPSEEFDNSSNQGQADHQDTVTQSQSHSYSNNNNPDSNFQVQETPSTLQKSILMHIDEKVVTPTNFVVDNRGPSQPHSSAPYGRFAIPDMIFQKRVQSPLPVEPTQAPQEPIENMQTTSMQPQIVEPTTSTMESEAERSRSELPHLDANVQGNHEVAAMEPQDNRVSKSTQLNSEPKSELPLRFSILVGDNQPSPSNGWVPTGQPPTLVMNSTNVDVDNIVIPGKGGQLSAENEPRFDSNPNVMHSINENYIKRGVSSMEANSRVPDQNIDTSASNSVAAEVHISDQGENPSSTNNLVTKQQPSQSAASHDCQIENGRNRLRAIIWTGSIVIALNVCLVILSLALYFKKVHLRKNHSIVRAASECGTHGSNHGFRWPSVILKSKHNLGGTTSLNTHEHFFCKLNSTKPSGGVGTSTGVNPAQDYNWPAQMLASSSQATLSSTTSPLNRVTNIRVNRSKFDRPMPFDSHASLRSNNFGISGNNHKSILEINSYDNQSANMHATYTNNIDDIESSEGFHGLR